jgi:pimeloyl-ACP methyl ester carboxylesterase
MSKFRCGALAPVVLLALLAASSLEGKTGEVSVNGLSFAYLDEGCGPPMVLMHGSISDYREWSSQMTPFAQHYRVIAYDAVLAFLAASGR